MHPTKGFAAGKFLSVALTLIFNFLLIRTNIWTSARLQQWIGNDFGSRKEKEQVVVESSTALPLVAVVGQQMSASPLSLTG